MLIFLKKTEDFLAFSGSCPVLGCVFFFWGFLLVPLFAVLGGSFFLIFLRGFWPFWRLGPSWGRLGWRLGPSWGRLGPSWGLLGPIVGPILDHFWTFGGPFLEQLLVKFV